jgi:hypothetical protein
MLAPLAGLLLISDMMSARKVLFNTCYQRTSKVVTMWGKGIQDAGSLTSVVQVANGAADVKDPARRAKYNAGFTFATL